MTQTWPRLVLLVWVCTVLLGHAARAEEAQPLQPCVLVLPLQASSAMSGDQVFLGLAVQNVLENMLAVHSTLEECRALPFLRQVFPQQQALRAWVQGTGEVPAAMPTLGVRYLLTGQVRQQGEAVQVTVELLDRATGHRLPSTLTVDFPRLEVLRTGFLELLAHAGLPVPESHKPMMLWPEDLSLTVFTLLGQGLYAYTSAFYDGERAVFHPEPFTEAFQRAPHSYLVLNNLGWVVYMQQRYAEAIHLFEQALVINPAGADVVDGMIQSGIVMGNEALAETWTAHKARMQGKNVQRPLAQGWSQRGMQLYHNSDYSGAIVAWEQALTLWREVKARAEEGIILSNLGLAYWALNQYERAISSYEPALAIMRAVNNRAGEGTILHNLGEAYGELSQSERAIGYLEQALVIAREIKAQAREAAILNNLGEAYRALSQYERAIGYHEQALAIAREVKAQAEEGAILTNLGEAYRALSQSERAIGYHEQALAIAREVKDQAEEGTILTNLGLAYFHLSQSERAIDYYEQALAIAREVKARAGEGTTLNNLGLAYWALSQSERAIGYYEQALAIAREVKARASEGITLNNLGAVYRALSQYERAIGYYEQALAIMREVKDRAGEGATLNNLGLAYMALSQYERAIGYHEQALAIVREVKNRAGEGTILNNLGQAYMALSQYERAIGYYEQALAIHREVKNQAGEGATLNNLGLAYMALSQYERASSYYEQALAIMREVKDRAGEGATLNNLGAVYEALSQYERAIGYYEQALAIHREVKNRAMEGTTLGNLMMIWEARQVPRLAIFYGKQAVNVYQTIRGDIHTLDTALQQSFLTSRTGTYRTLADLLITAGRLPEAQQVLELLKAEEYLDFVRRDAQAAGGIQHATLTPEEAEWEQRYRAIADRVTALGVERQALLAKPSRTAEDNTRLDALEHDLTIAAQAFQEFLSGLAEALRGTPEGSARLAEVREAQGLMADLADLGPGTVALYTLVGEKTYRVILITPHTQVARDYPITAADLNRKVLALREALRTPEVDPRPLAHTLYQILVAPVANDLQGAQAQTLLWSLDGVLRYLPMAALHDGEAYLVERYRHVLFTPASQARLKDVPQPTWTGLGLGVSQAHGDFTALPGVVEELQGIIRDDGQATPTGMLPGTIQLDGAFTAQAMRAALRQRYPVVHIASHFAFRPGNETASFLLLGDGSHLPLSELKTWPNVFAGVDLLTLSACDTAMGTSAADGKEVEGFGVLAQRQGAKAVIATLWPVADASTKALMQTLYRRRETPPGMPKIEALRQAQLALLHGPHPAGAAGAHEARGLLVPETEPRDGSRGGRLPFPVQPEAPYAHPFYWAPFILIGNWK